MMARNCLSIRNGKKT
jgi:hypothetical protein